MIEGAESVRDYVLVCREIIVRKCLPVRKRIYRRGGAFRIKELQFSAQ